MSHTVELVIALVSTTMFVGTLAAIPWLFRRLPADYFVRPIPKHSLIEKILRNVLGVTLIAAGLAMLILPGQGVITILLGLSILDLPIKQRLVLRILGQPRIRHHMQRLRVRAGKPPLVIPERRQQTASAPRADSGEEREKCGQRTAQQRNTGHLGPVP